MDREEFLSNLGLPVTAEIDAAEQSFIGALKERLQQVAERYNETELRQEDAALKTFLRQYFEYTLFWVKKEADRTREIREFDTAGALKQQAKGVVTELQDYIAAFVSCYVHIGRFMTLLRDEIKAEEIKASAEARKVRWTADSGVVIARYRRDKKQLLERQERLARARSLLEGIDGDFDTLRGQALVLFGREGADLHVRRFVAALRVLDFRKAGKALKEIDEAKKKFGLDSKTAKQGQDILMVAAARILKLVEAEQKTLMSEENRIFLRPVEVDVAYNADIRELQKIKAFLEKYHLPYMQYKLDALSHLKDKLLVLHSLESLMTLYKRLIMGIARPLRDIKTVRLYESEILNHVKYLLTGHFTELPKILQRAEETVEEFRQSRRELEEFGQLDLDEVAIAEQAESQG